MGRPSGPVMPDISPTSSPIPVLVFTTKERKSRFVLVQGPGTVRFCKERKESSIAGEIVGREISPPRCRWNHLRIAT